MSISVEILRKALLAQEEIVKDRLSRIATVEIQQDARKKDLKVARNKAKDLLSSIQIMESFSE